LINIAGVLSLLALRKMAVLFAALRVVTAVLMFLPVWSERGVFTGSYFERLLFDDEALSWFVEELAERSFDLVFLGYCGYLYRTGRLSGSSFAAGPFARFLRGEFGLPLTFWLCGVIPAIVLDYTMELVASPWQWLTVAALAVAHVLIISVATWNAATKYARRKLWAILAKVAVVLSGIKWAITLPALASAFWTVLNQA
jgi:hypothetical protein